MASFAEGSNYSVTVEGPRTVLRIWKRPDLSSDDGSNLAVHIAKDVGLALASTRSLLLDLRAAPSVSGPRSLDAMGAIGRACERGRIRIAIIIGDDAVQRLQIQRLIMEFAPTVARCFDDEKSADEWLRSDA